MATACQDLGRSSGTADRGFPRAEAPPSAARWPGYPTRNAGGPHGPRHSRAGASVRAARAASRRDAHFLEGATRGGQRLGAVHLQRLFEGIAEVLPQFLAGLALGIDPRDFLDPANPPLPVLLDDRGIVRCHEGLRETLRIPSPAGSIPPRTTRRQRRFRRLLRFSSPWFEER